ncbi:MAG: NAD(P)-dependent oxidoreductase [Gammaproteobacteria bacterium]|nr:NAD(P)-dependent oxidoreductase [Gammaproteobacteria bacterium]
MFEEKLRIGIIGSGYISRHFYATFHKNKALAIPRVLTRRQQCPEYPNQAVLTHSVDDLLEQCDIVYECSGDAIHASEIIAQAFAAGKPVATTNSEFHVTTGGYFADKGLLSEAEGDQPGALAALNQRACAMGFRPLAYLNMKGFLNPNPELEQMRYWAKRNGISVANTISFTDGTKIQFEQALIANGLQADLLKDGMVGLEQSDLTQAATYFAEAAKKKGRPISDYIIYPGAPHGVFIVAEHDDCQKEMLRYVKMGEGPYYILKQDAILVHMEVLFTMRQLLERKQPLLNNSTSPRVNVAAIAKQRLERDSIIDNGIGSFSMRGLAVSIKNYPKAVPIGLMQHARIVRAIEPGQILTFDDVELPQTLALKAWTSTIDNFAMVTEY